MKEKDFIFSLQYGIIYQKILLRCQWMDHFKNDKGFESFLKTNLKNKNLSKIVIGKQIHYKLSDTSNLFAGIRKYELEIANYTAKSILGIVLKETKKRLNDWVDISLTKNLRKMIAEEIENEFSKEVLPVLLKKIDIRSKETMTFNKEQVKKFLIEILNDAINKEKRG